MNGLEQNQQPGQIIPFPTKGETKKVDVKVDTKDKSKHRVYAFFTDLFFIALLQKVLIFSYVNFVNEAFHQVPVKIKANLLGSLSEMRAPTLVLTFFSYFLISLYLGHGKTLGKTLFKLRVLSFEEDPSELSFMEAFMRTLGYTTCYVTAVLNPLLPFMLFAIPLLRKDKAGIPDFFSQTEVFTEEEFSQLLFEREQERISQEEQLQITNNEQLDLFA